MANAAVRVTSGDCVRRDKKETIIARSGKITWQADFLARVAVDSYRPSWILTARCGRKLSEKKRTARARDQSEWRPTSGMIDVRWSFDHAMKHDWREFIDPPSA